MNEAAQNDYPLVVIQTGPYAGSVARSAVDVALSLAVFNQQPLVLFSGPGVRCLAQSQNPSAIDRKSLAKIIDSFGLYDIESVFVDQASLTVHGMTPDELPAYTQLLDNHGVQQLCSAAAQILSF